MRRECGWQAEHRIFAMRSVESNGDAADEDSPKGDAKSVDAGSHDLAAIDSRSG